MTAAPAAPARRGVAGEEGRGHAAMLAFSAVVAGSFTLGARVAHLIDPLAFTAVRFWIAAAVIALMVRASGPVRRPAAPWRMGVLGLLYALYFVLMFLGLRTAAPVSAAAVFTLTPVMAAGFGFLLLRQRMTRRLALGLALGAGGALWVIFRGDLGAALALEVGRGEAIYFVGCVAHALYTPLVPRLNRGEGAAEMSLWVVVAGALILTALGLPAILATPWLALPGIAWAALLYTGIGASAVTMTLLQYAALRLPAAKVMAYTYLVPAWVILWERAFGAPLPAPLTLVGAGLTALALALLLRPDPQP